VREVDPWDLAETVRESLLVLDSDLTIRFANRSFCDTSRSRLRIPSAGSSMSSATDSGTIRTPHRVRNYHFWWKIIEVLGKSTDSFASIGRCAMVLTTREPSCV
jgi:hypothetical protein